MCVSACVCECVCVSVSVSVCVYPSVAAVVFPGQAVCAGLDFKLSDPVI